MEIGVVPYLEKMDNIVFMNQIKRRMRNIIPIPNKISVLMEKDNFMKWIDDVYAKGVRHIVIVGGEHADIGYPGFSVTEAIRYIKSNYKEMLVGGITIFTRPQEVERIIRKLKSGMDFFVSQIIFETANMKHVLLHLEKECAEKKLTLPSVYISLSPASSAKDIEFMKWLGVEFPSAVLEYLRLGSDHHVEEHTFEVLERLLDEIFYFIETSKLDLGFNIEHVRYTNLEQAEVLLKGIKKRMAK